MTNFVSEADDDKRRIRHAKNGGIHSDESRLTVCQVGVFGRLLIHVVDASMCRIVKSLPFEGAKEVLANIVVCEKEVGPSSRCEGVGEREKYSITSTHYCEDCGWDGRDSVSDTA